MTRHFIYFENGGPFPGICQSCGNNKTLYDLGGQSLAGGNNLLCKKCVIEIATFIGYVEEAPLLEQMYNLEADIEAHERELARVPDLVDGLINGIRSSLTDFIFDVSYSDHVDRIEDVEKFELPSKPADQHSTTAKQVSSTPKQPASK
jgi:hypothetical protein